MAPQTSTSTGRPYQAPILTLHIALGFLGVYKLLIETRQKGVPAGFDQTVETGVFPNGQLLKRRFLGVPGIDHLLQFLTVAFIAGPAGWDVNVRLQQIHFLHNFAGILAMLIVESRRTGNGRCATTWIAIWACFYQTLGGAFVIPLWFAADIALTNSNFEAFFASKSAKASVADFSANRLVPVPYASFLLPATIMGYILPTALLYVPWGWSFEVAQVVAALWQPSPQVTSLILSSFAGFAKRLSVVSAAPPPPGDRRRPADADTRTPPDDVFYLKQYYIMVGALCLVVHGYVVYQIYTNGYAAYLGVAETVTFASVFLPDQTRWKNSLAAGLHYTFQIDAMVIFATAVIWSTVKAWDVLRALQRRGLHAGSTNVVGLLKLVVSIAAHNVILGPGATVMALWYWRENQLVRIAEWEEVNGEKGEVKKVR